MAGASQMCPAGLGLQERGRTRRDATQGDDMVDAYRRRGEGDVTSNDAEASSESRGSARRTMRVPKRTRAAVDDESREALFEGDATLVGSGSAAADPNAPALSQDDVFGTSSGIHVKAPGVPSLDSLYPEAPRSADAASGAPFEGTAGADEVSGPFGGYRSIDPNDPDAVRTAVVHELTVLARCSAHRDAVEGEGALERLLASAKRLQDPMHSALDGLAREVRRLRLLADTDPMTGVANRRVFCDAVARELSRQRRDGGPVSVAVLDLDGLKRLNDTLGHGVGDRAIRALAECCQGAVRGADLVGRLGGDEFALLLCGIDARRAQRVVRRIHGALADRRAGGEPISASVGVACAMAGELTVGQLLRAADEALYRDKSTRAGHRMSRPGVERMI